MVSVKDINCDVGCFCLTLGTDNPGPGAEGLKCQVRYGSGSLTHPLFAQDLAAMGSYEFKLYSWVPIHSAK